MIGDCAHTLAYTGSAFTGAIAIAGILLVLLGASLLVLRKTRSRKKAMLTLGLVAILGIGGLTTINSPGAFAATTCAPSGNTDPSATTTGTPGTPAGSGQTGTGPTRPSTSDPATPTPTPSDPVTVPTTEPSTPISVNAAVTANSSPGGTPSVSLVNSDDTTPLPAGTTFHLSYTAAAILSPDPDYVPGTTTSTVTVGTISPSLECTGIRPGEVFGPSLSVDVEADCTLLTDLSPGQSASVQITVDPTRAACESWTGPGITITGFPTGYTDSNPADNQFNIPQAIDPCTPQI
jgi:LPXTG-motif cell wall-anchored protein